VKDRRAARLAEEIREVVADIVAHRLKDPRIGFVTITRVELSADQNLARVLFSVLGEAAERKATLAGLSKAAGFVRRELGQRIRLRQTPEVQFAYDKGLDAADRVVRLLDEVRAADAAAPRPGAEPEAEGRTAPEGEAAPEGEPEA
jgi:ribosome-binding factor A